MAEKDRIDNLDPASQSLAEALNLSFKILKIILPLLPKSLNLWGKGRELPNFAKKNFREIYKESQNEKF